MVSGRARVRAGLTAAAISLFSAAAWAAPSTKIGTAPLISPGVADAYYGGASVATNGTGASGRAKEVVELARALKGNPDLIYEHIRNNIATTWTYGLSKGAVGVIVDRAGTALDQAQLMVELLREAGHTADYKIGTINLSPAQFEAWAGITSAKAACQLLSSGGIPAVINGSTTADCSYTGTVSSIEVGHAWVSVVIGGVSYVYDPAFKDHTFKAGLNLATATGMSPGMATGLSASSGTASGVPYVVSYNNATLTSNLGTYSNNLETYINTNAASGGIADVVGGKTINPQAIPPSGLRQTSLPYTANVLRTISGELPNQYRTKLTITITKARPSAGPDAIVNGKVVYADEVYGRRLTFEPNFDTTGASFTAALKLTDDMGSALTLNPGAISYADNPSFSRGSLTLAVDLPYAAASGSYMDATVARDVSYALPFTIVTGFGDVGRGLIDKWGQRRDSAMPAPGDAACKVCFVGYKARKGDGRRETLAAAWLAQASRAGQLNAAIGKGVFAQHYSLGVSAADTTVFQTANGSWWITDSFDRLDVETGFSLTSASADASDRRGMVLAAASSIAALKGGVSAQISDLPDVSATATRFLWGNAPPTGEDPAGQVARRFYEYSTATQAAQAMALSKVENLTTTSATGLHDDGATSPTIGSTETTARRQALADAISAYVTAGFVVAASEEAFLGPGARAGAYVPEAGGQYSHRQTAQRGGAIAAVKYDVAGDPIEFANVLVNPGGYQDAGGAGAQIFHQAQYDPATSADVVKGRFVLPPPGSIVTASPAKVSVGQGEFPYSLSASLIFRGGDVRDDTYGPASHREPQGVWTTNFTNNLTISGSGLEAMGESDARAAVGTIAAFYAAQDAYKASPSLKRDLAGQLITAWWVGTLRQNVATASIGTETRQWLKKPNGAWLTPGAATYGDLALVSGDVVTSARHPSFPEFGACRASMITYVPTRGWLYSSVYKVTGAKGDEQVFSSWTNQIADTSGTPTCAEQRGFRLTTWTWLKGVQLTWAYYRSVPTQVEGLASVKNNLDKWIRFTNGGWGGIYASTSNASTNLMNLAVSTSGSQVSHTDAVGAVTKFDVATLGAGDFGKLRIDKIYAADDANSPASQYIYDSLGRVMQSKDKLVLAGSRAPTQFFLADGLRSEILDAAGYSDVTYADSAGRPVRTIDGAGAASTVTYDGRGRPIETVSPDGDRTQFQYELTNELKKVTRLARLGSADAGQTLVTETGWASAAGTTGWVSAPRLLPMWTKDAGGAQTDYTYKYGEVSKVLLPPPTPGATRLEQNDYTYSNGLKLSTTTALGRSVSLTYAQGTSRATLTDSVGSTSGTYSSIEYSSLGDPIKMISPRGAYSSVTYDAARRPTLIAEPLPTQMYCTTPTSPTSCSSSYGSPYIHPRDLDTSPRRAKRLTYDQLGRVWKLEIGTLTGANFVTYETYTNAFDAVGNLVRQTGPTGVVQTSFDALNRPVCTAVRMNAAVHDALPADACVASALGAFGPDRITRLSYDPAGRITHQESGVGSPLQQVTTRTGYSLGGQQTTLTDANGNQSTFEYDGFGRLKRLRYPAAPRGSGVSSTADYEEYGYDASGNRTSFRKRSGQVITYQYDALNRLIVKDLPGTTVDDVYLSYSADGRQTFGRLGSPTAATYWRLDVDQAGRLKYDASEGAVTQHGLTTVTYDAEGNRTAATFGGGGRPTYTAWNFDLLKRPTTATYKFGASGVVQPLASFAYDALGRRASLNRPNGVVTSYQYDQAGRLSGLTHSAAEVSQGSYQTFAYNPAGQLVASEQTSEQYIWSGQPTTTTNLAHDQLNRDAAIAAATGYDADGNLTSDGTRTFTYDAENRLRSVTGGPVAISLEYDPFGRLSRTSAGGVATNYRYAGPQITSEYVDGSHEPLRSYVTGLGVDEWLLWREGYNENSVPKWFAQDRLGSVISVSDAAGNVAPFNYGPYGEPQSWAESRFRYTGQMAIPEAQLYHYRARAYDPLMGRFLQPDPIGYDDGPNAYAYVHGDPLNAVDPDGNSAWRITRVIVVPGTSNPTPFYHSFVVVGNSLAEIETRYSFGPGEGATRGFLVNLAGSGSPTDVDDRTALEALARGDPNVRAAAVQVSSDATGDALVVARGEALTELLGNANQLGTNPTGYRLAPGIMGGYNSNSAAMTIALGPNAGGSGNGLGVLEPGSAAGSSLYRNLVSRFGFGVGAGWIFTGPSRFGRYSVEYGTIEFEPRTLR